jgi:hypothetical protein
MLITVLAAEASSGCLSLRASVMLASILTVTMLPWALAMVRRSPLLSAMILAMIGMLWRAEAWKTVCLAEEAQLSQCLQSLPKTVSIRQRALAGCAGAHHVLPQVLHPFLAEEFEETHRPLKPGIQTRQDRSEPHKGNHKAPVNLQPLDLEAYLALVNAEPDFEPRELRLGSHTDFRRSGLELPTQSEPTPQRNAWQTHEPRDSDICQAVINPSIPSSGMGALVRVSGNRRQHQPVVALVIGDSHTCGTVRSAQETVKHIARVSVASRRGTLKILTTETSDLGPVVLSA